MNVNAEYIEINDMQTIKGTEIIKDFGLLHALVFTDKTLMKEAREALQEFYPSINKDMLVEDFLSLAVEKLREKGFLTKKVFYLTFGNKKYLVEEKGE